MVSTDLYRHLSRLHTALNGLMAVEIRQSGELTPAEVALESAWQEALEPELADLYWYPFRNGLSAAPDDEEELRAWLRRQLGTAAAVAALLALMNRYLVRGANVGGQMGLGILGASGTFRLTNRAYLAELEEHAGDMTTLGTDLSLIDTTVDDLVRGVPRAKEDEGDTLAVLGALIAGWAVHRSGLIAGTELARMTGRGLTWVYGRNGIAQMEFNTRADDQVCPICAPLNGLVVPVNNIPSEATIPRHVGCRCYWLAVLTGWQRPAGIWRGA